MVRKIRLWARLLMGAILLLGLGVNTARAGSLGDGSSSEPPYIVQLVPRVKTKAILTVGDSVNNRPDGTPYRLVGIPDGLGAYDNGDGTFTLLVNHEIGSGLGIVRDHGANGAFVSKWTIRKGSLKAVHGEDLIQNIATWNTGTGAYNEPAKGIAVARFCSANLPSPSALYDSASGLGYNGRLFMNGEEVGAEGRAFGHLLDGTSYELPRLGKFSWENAVANPATGTKTVVLGLDDTDPGQLYLYVGDKTSTGLPIDQAGLTNGNLYGVKVTGYPAEDPEEGIPSGTEFTLHPFGNVENMTGATLETLSVEAEVTNFERPEDGAWDPSNPSDFYFVTTASFDAESRLWRLHFNNPADPAAGGQIDMLLDGTEGHKMLDNLTVTKRGHVVIQEDPGQQAYLAKIWDYTIATGAFTAFAEHDPDRFLSGGSEFLTENEESSGIIDASEILGKGWFLLTVQAHYTHTDPELVEGGQLLALRYRPGDD